LINKILLFWRQPGDDGWALASVERGRHRTFRTNEPARLIARRPAGGQHEGWPSRVAESSADW
jgi:hypothetical protein